MFSVRYDPEFYIPKITFVRDIAQSPAPRHGRQGSIPVQPERHLWWASGVETGFSPRNSVFQWPRGLRRGCAAARLLGLRVRIPPGAWMSVPCECCVLSSTGLCDGLITRPEEPYGVGCVWVWSLSLDNEEALAHWGWGGCHAIKKSNRRSPISVTRPVLYTHPHSQISFIRRTSRCIWKPENKATLLRSPGSTGQNSTSTLYDSAVTELSSSSRQNGSSWTLWHLLSKTR